MPFYYRYLLFGYYLAIKQNYFIALILFFHKWSHQKVNCFLCISSNVTCCTHICCHYGLIKIFHLGKSIRHIFGNLCIYGYIYVLINCDCLGLALKIYCPSGKLNGSKILKVFVMVKKYYCFYDTQTNKSMHHYT